MASSLITVPNTKGAHMYENAPLELFIDVYIVAALVCLIPQGRRGIGLRTIVKALVYVFAYAVYIIDTFCFVKFGTTLNPTMLMLVGETNSNEASEFLTNYLSVDILCSGVGVMVLIAVLHVCLVIACRCLRRHIHIPPLAISRANGMTSMAWHGVGSLPVVALLVWAANTSWQNKQLYVFTMSRQTIGEVEHSLAYSPHTQMYQPPMRLAFSLRSNQLVGRQLDELHHQTVGLQIDSCTVKSPSIVLIIGESFNKRHAQIYGYDKPDMPVQTRLMRQRRLIKFNDVVAPWNLTSFFFKHLMTTYVVGDEKDWCDYPLFCQLFREAGYQVNFFTNQFLPRAREAVFDFSGGFFINDPELSALQFDVRNDKTHRFDEDLIHDFDRLLPDSVRKASEKPQLTIFHVMGQHVNYRQRYPSNKAKWGADDYPNDMDLNAYRRRVMAGYDNATWYNDSVVGLIIDRFKRDEAIVIYLADHGEEVFGPQARTTFGRLHDVDVNKRMADEEFRVPMWVYTSPLYARNHPEVVQQIRAAADKPYMTDAMSHMLLGLAGIHCKYYNERYDILSPHYDAHRKRLLKNSIDYDQLK